VTTQKT